MRGEDIYEGRGVRMRGEDKCVGISNDGVGANETQT